MKSEQPGDQPETGNSEPAAPEVAHDDGPSRHAIHLAQHEADLMILEMMQHLGARHHVDTPRLERKQPCVAAYAPVENLAAERRERRRFIDPDGVKPDSFARRDPARPEGYVRKAGAYVEQRGI